MEDTVKLYDWKDELSEIIISDGENRGVILFENDWGMVNWDGINPRPLPPLPYPKNIFMNTFGEYEVIHYR